IRSLGRRSPPHQARAHHKAEGQARTAARAAQARRAGCRTRRHHAAGLGCRRRVCTKGWRAVLRRFSGRRVPPVIVTRLAYAVMLAFGWRRAIIAFVAGGAMAAAVAGWCFGFGYFLAGLYWLGYAFLVDAKTFGWLLPVAVAGLPAYLAF